MDGRWVDDYYLDLEHRGVVLEPDFVLAGIYVRYDLDGQIADSLRRGSRLPSLPTD